MFTNGQPADQQEPEIVEDGTEPAAPAATSQPGEAPTDAPQYLTRDDLMAFAQAQERQMRRLMQSQRDSYRDLRQKFQQLQGPYARAVEVAVQKGHIRADQKEAFAKALQDDAVAAAFADETGAPPRGGRQNPAPQDYDDAPQPPGVAAINAEGERLAASLGLAQGDPELENVILDGTPEDFLASIRVAARMKQRRTQAPQQPPPNGGGQPAAQPQPRKPAGRSPAVGGAGGRPAPTNAIAHIESAEELYALAWQQERGRQGRG